MTQPKHAHETDNGPAPARFEGYTQRSEFGCWTWNGKVGRDGYGRFFLDGRWLMAHRYAYERAMGRIPEGLEIDHLCRNKLCVKPSHLEAVTRRENMHRQPRIAALMAQTHCKRGHEYTPENTRIDTRGNRNCKACKRLLERERRHLRRSVQ